MVVDACPDWGRGQLEAVPVLASDLGLEFEQALVGVDELGDAVQRLAAVLEMALPRSLQVSTKGF